MWNCISRIPYPGNWWFLFGYASHGAMQSGWGLGYVRAPVCWTAMNFGSTCDWGEHGHATKCPHHRAGDGSGHVVARLMKVKDCFGGAMNISEPLWPWRCPGFFVQVIKLRQINESQMIKFVTQDGECIPRPGVFWTHQTLGFYDPIWLAHSCFQVSGSTTKEWRSLNLLIFREFSNSAYWPALWMPKATMMLVGEVKVHRDFLLNNETHIPFWWCGLWLAS